MPTTGQILVAVLMLVAVLVAAGVVPFTALVVGLLIAFGLGVVKFVP